MRPRSLQELNNQFPDIDGFWGQEPASAVEFTLRNKIKTYAQPFGPEQIEWLSQLGRSLLLQDKIDDAKKILADAFAKAEALPPSKEKDRCLVRLSLENGRLFWITRSISQAQGQFKKAWELAETNSLGFFLVDAAVMMTLISPAKQKFDWLDKAFMFLGADNDPATAALTSLWRPHLHILKAWQLFDARRFQEAYEDFEKASRLQLNGPERVDKNILKWSLARSLRSLHRLPEALEILYSLKNEFEKNQTPQGEVFLEIGECLQLQQQVAEAKTYFELAYAELSKNPWYIDNQEAELSRIRFLSKLR